MTAAIVIGVLVWTVTLLLDAVLHGPWLGEDQWLAFVGPPLALVLPGLLNLAPRTAGRFLLAWGMALAPLLATGGVVLQFFLERAIRGNVYSPFYAKVSSAVVLFGSAVVAVLLHVMLRFIHRRITLKRT